MMNALRLYQPVPWSLITQRTGLAREDIQKTLRQRLDKDLINLDGEYLYLTTLGRRFLNQVLVSLLPEPT